MLLCPINAVVKVQIVPVRCLFVRYLDCGDWFQVQAFLLCVNGMCLGCFMGRAFSMLIVGPLLDRNRLAGAGLGLHALLSSSQ